jgi:hypothetical protein
MAAADRGGTKYGSEGHVDDGSDTCLAHARARERANGKRFVVRADEILTAFMELESAIRRAVS